MNMYADMCEKLCFVNSPRGYKYINYAIDIISKQSDLNEDRINKLRFKLDEEQKKLYDSFHFQNIPIDSEINEKISTILKQLADEINSESDSIKKVLKFLEVFKPVKKREISNFTKGLEQSTYTNFFNEIFFDKNKRVVNEIGPDDVEKRNKQNIIQAYILFHSIYFRICMIYLNSVMVDLELEDLFTEIISHNELVPSSRMKIVKDYLIGGLNKNIRKSVYLLISQFEYGCIEYLKNKKGVYPVITKGSMTVTVDLNHILTIKKFRDCIVELLGEDLTKELQYLLVEKHYGNLRNQDYHEGFDREDVFTNIELIVFFRLINAYCFGYDELINKVDGKNK